MEHEDILFGYFIGQSKLKQGNDRIHLTPDEDSKPRISDLTQLAEATELEGSFGVVAGRRDGNVLYEARIEEVVPPILSGVLRRLLDRGDLDAEATLPKVERSIRSLIGTPDTPSRRSTPLCAVVVGHRLSAKGAVSANRSVTEFDFNKALAREIKARVRKARVKIVYRDNTPAGLTRLPAKINAHKPDFILSLHCNAFNKKATGTETLYYHTSKLGKKLAVLVQKQLVQALDLPDRRTKPKTDSDRGAGVLKFTHAPCVICEPFFIDNDSDLDTAQRRRKSLSAAYARAIDQAATELAKQ